MKLNTSACPAKDSQENAKTSHRLKENICKAHIWCTVAQNIQRTLKTLQLKSRQKIDSSSEKISRWQISIWKNVQHHVIKKLQIKTTRYLLEWLKSKTQHQILARMWSSRNSHSLLVGIQNGIATLEARLAASLKHKI